MFENILALIGFILAAAASWLFIYLGAENREWLFYKFVLIVGIVLFTLSVGFIAYLLIVIINPALVFDISDVFEGLVAFEFEIYNSKL